MTDHHVRSVTNRVERVLFAHICVDAIQADLTSRQAMDVALVIATTPCPIFAIMDESNPVAIAVCSLDLPGYARRLRFAWTDPSCRKMGFGLTVARHVVQSAKHVGVAVRHESEKRIAERAGFMHWRRADGGWAGATTKAAFRMPFAHPNPTPEAIADAMRSFGLEGRA